MSERIANIDLTPVDPEWHQEAACKDQPKSLFFGHTTERRYERLAREKKAKAICETCEVQVPCLEGALERQEKFGIWGGTNAEEREAMLRRRSAR